MNPLRALMVSLSRIPPAAMLLAVVGLAILATLLVTTELGKRERELQLRISAIDQEKSATGTVIYVVKDVSEGQTFSADMLAEKQIQLHKIPQEALGSRT